MQTYTVHEPPDVPADHFERSEQLVFVKEGFSLTAALLAPFWMLANRLWLALLLYLAAFVGLEVIVWLAGIAPNAAGWMLVAMHLVIGLEADSIRRWTLARNGYRMVGSVCGRGVADCERRFFEAWLDEQPFVSSAPPASTGGNASRGTGGRLSARALWPS